MSKKKNKKSSKAKASLAADINNPKKPTKKASKAATKVYKDEFLGKEVDLVESPYQVYNEAKKSNLPVLRGTSELQKEDPDTQIQEIINENIDESELQDFLSNVKKEKEDFEKEINKKIIDEKLKHPIYNHTKPPRQGLKGAIADVLESDVLWYSVTFSLILGLLFFFFNGLQPLILANYLTQSKLQAQSLESDYSSKVNGYFIAQNNLIQRFDTYNPTLLCNQQDLYSSFDTDFREVERVKNSYFPNPDLITNPSYNNFYLEEVDSQYLELTNTYKTSLQKYQDFSQDLVVIANYLEFRNTILSICKALAIQPRNLEEITTRCSQFALSLTELKSIGTPNFYPDVEEGIDSISASCLAPVDLNPSVFYLNVDSVMFYRPSFDAINAELIELNNTFESKYNTFKLEMDRIYEDKISLLGLWYIMKYDLS
jgi:hypothetical protein